MVRRVLAGVLVGLGVLLVLDAIATRAGVAPGFVPSLGAAAWATSRAAGITAFVAVTLDVAFGLFISTGVLDAWISRARSVETHRWLSSVALALVAVHALALLADRFVRFDALDLVVPFLSSYRPIAVALGVFTAWAMLVVHASFDWIARIGGRAWRKLHYVSFFVFAAGAAHGLLAGTDAKALRSVTLGALALVGTLAGVRGAKALRRRCDFRHM